MFFKNVAVTACARGSGGSGHDRTQSTVTRERLTRLREQLQHDTVRRVGRGTWHVGGARAKTHRLDEPSLFACAPVKPYPHIVADDQLHGAPLLSATRLRG